jgi:glycosyltransferase involved in cell wall biosynthesis
MRVGVLVGNLNVKAGGSHTYAMQILNYLEKNKFPNIEFSFICSGDQFDFLNERFHGSVVAFNKPSRFKIQRYLGYLFSAINIFFSKKRLTRERVLNLKLLRALENSSLDIVWSIEPMAFPLDVPYVTTVWDLEHKRQPFFPEVSSYGEWERRESGYSKVLSRATFVITGTFIGKEQIEKFYGVNSERIIVAPFPLIPISINEVPTRDTNLIFYPAQFWPHKNHVNLILGFKLATQVEPSLRLVLVGSDKGNEEKIRGLVSELKLEKNVEFWGTVTSEVLESLYRTASLMIYPSLFGPDNLPPLEAISFKCPVAVADQPGSREQLLGGVPVFDATDEKEIGKTVLARRNFEISDKYYQEMLGKRDSRLFFDEILGNLQRFERIARNFNR